MLLFEHPQALQRHAAGQGVAHKGGAVHESVVLTVANERLVHPVGGQRGRMAQIPAGQPLGEHHDIRRDARVVGGKQPAGAAKAGGYFVENQQHAKLVAQRPGAAQVVRRGHVQPARRLQQRLHQ